jgi:hypothetical protein
MLPRQTKKGIDGACGLDTQAKSARRARDAAGEKKIVGQ